MEEEFKPNKRVFVTFRFLWSSLFLLLVFAVIGLILSFTVTKYVWPVLAVLFIILRTYSYVSLKVQYKKERYIIQDNRIINKGGGLFSDYETELNIKNITNVSMVLPFIEHWRFNTGSVNIQSAGSGATEIDMLSLDNYQEVYDKIQERMKSNGFGLNKDNLIQQENPHILGVIFESGQRFFASLAVIFFIMLQFAGATALFFNNYFLFATIALLLVLLGVFIWAILVFLDLKNRVYRVYSGVITYDEGFLTKRYALIPIENLADSSSTQNFVDRIFGLYDVIISSQGAGQEIKFKNMANGQQLEENLDKLISSTESLVGKKEEPKTEQKAPEKTIPKPQADTSYTAEFEMDMKRAMFPIFVLMVVVFPLIPLWIIMLIPIIIEVSATKFFVKPNSMEERYSFLSTSSKEFTNDKITAIIFKESIIDKLFNTFTINFWSIGSAQDIKFRHIKKDPEIVNKIIAKTGINPEEKIYGINSSFGLGRMLKAVLPLTIILTLVLLAGAAITVFFTPAISIPALLLIIFTVAVIYKKKFYEKSKISFYRDYIHFTKGLLVKLDYYVLYDNVKDITTTRYPFSSTGEIRFNVGGEHVEGQGNKQAVVSNSFTINYVEDISSKDELIDLIFYQRPEASKIKEIEANLQNYKSKVILETKPSLKNPLFTLIAVSIIILPMIIFFPITIPLAIIKVKVKSYRIEGYRVVARSGILYKKQTSIVFSKIDHINTSQGFLNKMFKNGNVTINTAGSSMPELIILNIPDFKRFYETLNSYY